MLDSMVFSMLVCLTGPVFQHRARFPLAARPRSRAAHAEDPREFRFVGLLLSVRKGDHEGIVGAFAALVLRDEDLERFGPLLRIGFARCAVYYFAESIS